MRLTFDDSDKSISINPAVYDVDTYDLHLAYSSTTVTVTTEILQSMTIQITDCQVMQDLTILPVKYSTDITTEYFIDLDFTVQDG